MSAQPKLSPADKLLQKLAKIRAAQRKNFLNENIVRLEKTATSPTNPSAPSPFP